MGEKQEKVVKNNGERKNDGDMNTIVLQFDMHCEGCAKKVRKSVFKLQGVESVKTEFSTNKMVVIGKVDPVKVKERVEEKIKKKAELTSLQPNAKEGGNGGGDKKKSNDKKHDDKKLQGKSDSDKKMSEDNETPKGKVKPKAKEPAVSNVQLKTKVHCEGCAQKIKKIVSKCEGVQDVNVDLQKDLITVKGTMNMKDHLPYLNLKLKRAVELAPTMKDQGSSGDKKSKEGGDGPEKPKEGAPPSEKPKKRGDGDKKDNGGDKKDNGGEKKKGGNGDEASSSKDNNTSRIEINKMEYNPYGYDQSYSYAYDPRQQGEGGHQVLEYWHAPEYSQPPQMFSDENPNACSIM